MSNELYWHFVGVDSNGTPRLGYGDEREVRVGEALRVEGEPVLCEHGLHASNRLWDALSYAQGDRLCLCRVTLTGMVKHDEDKAVATERTVVAMLDTDATDKLLRDFARWCALQVAHLWDAPDVVRQYLETGDEFLRDAARDAAWDARAPARAARSAAWAAEGAAWAAEGAAWATARSAARAAWAAARSAAWAAARSAAWAAEWAAEGDAAWAAEGDAAWDAREAAIEQYAAELERRGLEAMASGPSQTPVARMPQPDSPQTGDE